MTYHPHLLLAWGGSMGTSEEIWSNSLRLTADTEDGGELQSIAIDQIDEIAAEVKTFVQSVGAHYSLSCNLNFVKLNAITAEGKYWDTGSTNAIYYEAGDVVHGNATTGPFQMAMAVTLRTFRARGAAHAGRFYIPCGAIPTDSGTGRVPASITDAMASGTVTFLEAINDNPGFDTRSVAVAVVSKTGNPGPTELVTGVQVGNVPDTQRRRRNALLEDYGTLYPVTGQ